MEKKITLWKRRAVMEKTDTFGNDRQLWKRQTLMEKTGSMEKTYIYGKDGQLWKRQTLMEKTGSMEKTDTYGKDRHCGKDDHKAFKTIILRFKREAHTVLNFINIDRGVGTGGGGQGGKA